VSSTYGVSVNRAGVNTANTVLSELRTASTSRATLRQVKISMAVLPTTAPRFALARVTNTPVAGTAVTPIAMDLADPAALSSYFNTGQSTAPTFATAGPWIDVGGLPLTLGAGLIWTYPGQGLIVPASASLVLANLNASGATLGSFDISFLWEE
jgi:hypothetical protein